MFHKKAARYYDFFAGKDDLPFFRRLMVRLGGPVLDLGCGTGRLTFNLADTGLEVVGVDNSPYMLDIAAEKLDKQTPSIKERVKLVEGDMVDLLLDRQFASAIIGGGSLCYLLDTDEQIRCLMGVGKLLPVGGKLVLDLLPPTRELLSGGTSSSRSVAVDGDILLLRTEHIRCDLNSQRCSHTIIYQQYKDNVLIEQVLAQGFTSLIFPREVFLLLKHCGYYVKEVYGDTAGGDFSHTSRRMIVVAEKE